MLTPRFRTIRTTWVAVCVLLLIASLLTYNRTTNRDNDIFLYLAMMGLSFPAGYLVPVAYSFFPAHRYMPQLEMALLWMGWFVVGYVQWFVLVPRVVRFFRPVKQESQL